MEEAVQTIGFISAIVLPFWNVPLILRIVKRRSSGDISILWAIGVWVCLLGMLPSGLISSDRVWRTFNLLNFSLFTVVFVCTVVFHKKK